MMGCCAQLHDTVAGCLGLHPGSMTVLGEVLHRNRNNQCALYWEKKILYKEFWLM